MCVYVVCMHVCMYVLCVCVCMCVCMYCVYVCVCMYVYVVCTHVCMCVCSMYACMYVYVCMYASFHSSVNSCCGAVGCNTLPGGRVRQNLLPAWGCMLRWINGVDCQTERCHGWDQLSVKWCWRLRTNGRETDSVDSTQQTHFCSIEVTQCHEWNVCVVGWSALFWKMTVCQRCVTAYWSKPLKISANSKQVCKYRDILSFHQYRLSLPAYPRSANRSRWNIWHQYAFTVIVEIQPLNTGDKSRKVRQNITST